MCNPGLAMGIGVAISAASQVYSGMAESAAHKSNAKQYELQRFETRTKAMAESRQRFDEFAQLESANRAAIAATGLSNESFAHMTEANRKTALEDAATIEAQGRADEARLRFAAKSEKQAAKAKRIGGFVRAAGTVASGAGSIVSLNRGGG